MMDDADGAMASSGTAPAADPNDDNPPGLASVRSWRGWFALAGGLVVIVLVVGVVRFGSSGSAVPSPSAEPSARTPLTSFPAPRTTAPDGGELKIVEKGFAQRFQSVELTLTPGYGPNNPEPYTPVYSAVIIENTSRNYLAINANAVVKYLDKAGKGVPEGPGKPDEKPVGTDVIYPGERKGVADLLSVDDTPVADLTASPGTAVWMTKDQLERMSIITSNGCFAPRITTSEVRMIHTGSPKVIIVAFRVRSSCPNTTHAKAIVVYRDTSGKIVGSNDETIYDDVYFGPGDSDGSVLARKWFPPGMDEGKTEVYLLPTV